MLDHLIHDDKIKAGIRKGQLFPDAAHKHRGNQPSTSDLNRCDLGALTDPLRFQTERSQAAPSAGHPEAAGAKPRSRIRAFDEIAKRGSTCRWGPSASPWTRSSTTRR
jgi:hypothetical protein